MMTSYPVRDLIKNGLRAKLKVPTMGYASIKMQPTPPLVPSIGSKTLYRFSFFILFFLDFNSIGFLESSTQKSLVDQSVLLEIIQKRIVLAVKMIPHAVSS